MLQQMILRLKCTSVRQAFKKVTFLKPTVLLTLMVIVLTNQNDYTKNPNYWKYLKTKLKNENRQVVSATTQLKSTQ